jgi:hypothetical protein
MIRTLTTAALLAASVLASADAATADDACSTVDYQGAPLEICPEREPDPTNCYTGWYQGAPIEICLPTGEKLPEGSTYNGAPVVYHVSKDYTPPAQSVAAAHPIAPPPITAVTAPTSPPAEPAPIWVNEYVALLGW